MHNELIQDLACILLTGGIAGWIFKKFFKLPLILGYIFGGILISVPLPYTPVVVKPEIAHNLSELGVLLLMFSMGLHFGIRKIQSLGTRPIFAGLAECLSMWILGTIIARVMGFEDITTLFLGAVFSVSSTAVITKVLEDFQLKTYRFFDKTMGILLIEDAIAIFIIIWLSAQMNSQSQQFPLLHILPIFCVSVVIWWVFGTILLPRFIKLTFSAGREELLVIISVGLALGLAYLSSTLNFSSALGAFIMGSILSEARELKKIETLIAPIKNLFGLIFFLSVGLLFSPQVILDEWKFILIFTVFVIFGKIIFNIIYNILFGHGVKDSFRIAGSLGQVGELSFVIAQLGLYFGVIQKDIFSAIVVVAIVTMILTPIQVKIFMNIAEHIEHKMPRKLYEFLDTPTFRFYIVKNKVPFLAYIYQPIFSFLRFIKDNIHVHYRKLTSTNMTSTLERLAPWDEYLVPVRVYGGSKITGKNLIDLKLRELFNVNIVAIERDDDMIISPRPNETILSNDMLLVYGSELDIVKLEIFCFEQDPLVHKINIDDCLLVNFRLNAQHPFVGKSIVDIGVRTRYNCIVLAINRDGVRIKNPVSAFVFWENDEIFIFGQKSSIQAIFDLNFPKDPKE
jgi:CPA2 family monovalent cation:H+ antiporter-2